MQFRQLRYFVKIVDAGSFSRAATMIHVAQPALSQQIADLEDRLGIALLHRSARGVRPTAAGEALYREASSILVQLDKIPGIVRSTGGEPEGVVRVGLASSLAPTLGGPFIETCRAEASKVTLKLSDGDSASLAEGVEKNTLDMSVVYEDELVPQFSRKPLFRQRMYLIGRDRLPKSPSSASLRQIAEMPLVLPSLPNGRRQVIERAFAALGLKPNLVAEADTLSSELSVVRAGVANTILPTGDMSNFSRGDYAEPVLVEPSLFLTCTVISSSDFPLTHAAESIHKIMVRFVEDRLRKVQAPGIEWIA